MNKTVSMDMLPFKANMSERPSLGDILENIKNNNTVYVTNAEQLFEDYLNDQNTKTKPYRLILVTLFSIMYKSSCSLMLHNKIEKEFINLFDLAQKNDPINKYLLISFFTFINPLDQYEREYGTYVYDGIIDLLKRVNKSK